MWTLLPIKKSGTNEHGKLIADNTKELERAARLLRVPVKNSNRDQFPHLDLPPKKWWKALSMGARKKEDE